MIPFATTRLLRGFLWQLVLLLTWGFGGLTVVLLFGMIQFFAYLVIGVCWAELTIATDALGSNAVTYFSMIGALIILLVAAPLSLFLPRMASIAGLVGVLFMAFWLNGVVTTLLARPMEVAYNLRSHPVSFDGFLVFWLPAVIALYFVWKTREENWLAVSRWKRGWARIVLAALPVFVLATAFDLEELLGFLLQGPNG